MRFNLSLFRGAICLAFLTALTWCNMAAAATANELKDLVESNQTQEGYAAAKLTPDNFGDPAYDFYFGIAAVESGHAGEGVLAIERYILQYPDNISARLLLAKGYFVLGEDGRAREEFDALKGLALEPDVVATIDRFLDAIYTRESRYQFTKQFYAEFGVGYDTNVNGGVQSANITIPIFGPVIIASSGTQQANSVLTALAGGSFSYPVAPGFAIFGNAQVDSKFNSSEQNKAYEPRNWTVATGGSWIEGKNVIRLSLGGNELDVGDRPYLTTTSLQTEWEYQINEQQAATLGGQWAQLDYAGDFLPKNAYVLGLAASYKKLWPYSMQPILSLSINAGNQNSRTGRDDLVADTLGGTIALSFTPAPSWGASLSYTSLKSDYKAADILFGLARSDTYESLDAAVSYLVSRGVVMRGEYSNAVNNSNTALYSFPRETIFFKVRYEFK